MNAVALVFFIAMSMVAAQRPFYAGLKPIGYPELADRFQPLEDETTSTTASSLGNRFGEDGQTTVSTTTVRLPVDALGDKDLVDRISKWPVDKQPYWYINWKLIEAHRQQRPTIQEPSSGGLQQPTGSQTNSFQPQRPSQQNNVRPQAFNGQPQGSNGQPQGFNGQTQRDNGQPQGFNGQFQRPVSNQRQLNQQWRDDRRNTWQNERFIQD